MARIALDAMGGDFAPEVPVSGAIEALEELPPSCEVILVGRTDAVEPVLESLNAKRDRLRIVEAPEIIGMSETPLAAVRSKRKSSIRVGVDLQKNGEVDAFISAGNTGAMMAACTLLLGLHHGVERPAIGTLFPTASKPTLVLDAGANVDCSARELRGFAHCGMVYARDVLLRPEPTVALLNIGEEQEKGNQAVREAYALLAADPGIRFVGNVEGRQILEGVCDVVVCDGFVGNVLLKFYESVARLFRNYLRKEMDESVLKGPAVGRVFRALDYSETGGAPLLGVRGVAIICHGSSPVRAIKNAIKVALRAVESDLSRHIGDEFADGAVA